MATHLRIVRGEPLEVTVWQEQRAPGKTPWERVMERRFPKAAEKLPEELHELRGDTAQLSELGDGCQSHAEDWCEMGSYCCSM